MADLLTEVWRAGIETVSCCEDAGDASEVLISAFPHLTDRQDYLTGRCYVDFPGDAEAANFLNAVADAGSRDAFYVRMVHWAAPGAWFTTLSFDDKAMGDDDTIEQSSDFVPSLVQTAFPQTDIPEIVARLRRHNAGSPPVLGDVDWRSVEIDSEDVCGEGRQGRG